ncbi:plasmid mobilization relaxosome protein MobC, partial [Escherichia coli]|nr:plasmid mobilization relaxosome protein MobC [Escherichia coli]
AVAEARGMSRTQWITSLVRARLGVEHPQTGDERLALRAIARELNRIGGNVNQIARAANTEARSNRAVSIDEGALAGLG